MDWLPKIPTEVLYVVVAAIGGMARYLQHYLNEGQFSFRHLMAHLFISAFSGYMFYHCATDILGLPETTIAIFAGIGGWMGVEALKMVETVIKRKVDK